MQTFCQSCDKEITLGVDGCTRHVQFTEIDICNECYESLGEDA